MAVLLNGTSQYLTQSGALVSAVPLTLACWYKPIDFVLQNVLIGICNTSTSNSKFSMGIQNTAVVQATSVQAGTASVSNTTSTLTAGTWAHCAAVFTSTTSRTAYLNGVAGTANTASSTPVITGSPLTVIGANFAGVSTANAYAHGSLVFVGIWNVALSAAQISSLAGGAHPTTIQPGNLIACCNLIPGNLNPQPDAILVSGWTPVGSPTDTSNPSFYIDSPIKVVDTSTVYLANEIGYKSAAIIGNTGLPTTTNGRIPFRIPGVTVDSSNLIYTVHDYDEVHNDINFWTNATGGVSGTTGHIYANFEFDAIAVEPNGTMAYVTGWDNTVSPSGLPPFKLAIMKINPQTKAAVTFTTAGANISGGSLSTASTTGLLPIVVSGSLIWVVDNNANLLLGYDKLAGTQSFSTSVTAPKGIAVDGSGQLWVGLGTSINIYSSSGVFVATPLTGMSQLYSIAINGTTLVIADRGTGLVSKYTISGNTVTFVSSQSFNGLLNGVAVDSTGNIIVTEAIGVNGGARIREFNSSWVVQWTQTCTEFQSIIGYSPATPNVFVSTEQQVYNVNRATMTATWSGTANNPIVGSPPNSPIKVLTLGGNDFEYTAIGSGALGTDILNIYKRSGGALTSATQITNPGNWEIQSWSVDDSANIWLAMTDAAGVNTASVWKLPFTGLSGSGNPVYGSGLSSSFMVVPESAIRNALSFPSGTLTIMNCNYNASDGLIYVGVFANGIGPGQGIFNMGYNNLLAFSPNGAFLWNVTLPTIAVGMAVLPGGGAIVGGIGSGTGFIRRYTSTGASLGTIIVPQKFGVIAFPQSPTGQFDMYGALNAQLAPDGSIDIFAEDDYNGRIIWYNLVIMPTSTSTPNPVGSVVKLLRWHLEDIWSASPHRLLQDQNGLVYTAKQLINNQNLGTQALLQLMVSYSPSTGLIYLMNSGKPVGNPLYTVLAPVLQNNSNGGF